MSRRPLRRALFAAWAVSVTAWVVAIGVPTERSIVLLLVVAGLAVAPLRHSKLSTLVADWTLVIAVGVVYDLTRGAARFVDADVQVASVVGLERNLFIGALPSVSLQRITWPAWVPPVAAIIYTSHFIAPFFAGGLLWARDRTRWLRWRRLLVTVTLVAAGLFVMVPTAPPWVASRLGAIGPVTRTAADGWAALGIPIAERIITSGQESANLYAALPSLHTSYAILTVLACWPLLSRPGRAVAAGYPVAMAAVLVATGEHYVVDVLAGALLVAAAAGGWVVVDRWRATRAATVEGVSHVVAADAPVPIRHDGATVGMRRPPISPVIAVLAAVAAATRLPRLTTPHVFVYDEVFYVPDAVSLAVGDGQTMAAVHPPGAKYLIALAVRVAGVNPAAWRVASFVAGVVVVAVVVATVWKLRADRRIAAVAGLLVTFDGIAFVTGRLALLDAVASLVAVALLGVVMWARGIFGPPPVWSSLAGAVLVGVAAATKWTLLIWAVVAAGALIGPIRDHARGRSRRGSTVTAAIVVAAVAGAVFLAVWAPSVMMRRGVNTKPGGPVAGVVADAISMADFHLELDRAGPGHSPGWAWALPSKATNLFSKDCRGDPSLTDGVCPPGAFGTARISATGTAVVWAAGAVAFGGCIWTARRNAISALLACAVASLWIPWLLPGSAPYSFYGAPVVAVLAVCVGWVFPSKGRTAVSVALGAACVANFVVLYPELVGIVVQ